MPVIDGKAWPEMVHRYFAGTLGLLILGLAVIAIKNRSTENYPFRQSLFMFVLVVWQALFGMWTVTLKLWPQVVTLHLLGGFTTFALLVVLAQRLTEYRWTSGEAVIRQLMNLKPWLIGGILVVAGQVFLGGWIASNYAAFGCPPKEFPSCFGTYWPEMDFAHGFNIAQSIGPNYLGGLMESEGRTAIHYVHRIGALITTVYLVLVFIKAMKIGFQPLVRLSYLMLSVLLVQLVLGISNVMLVLPLSIAVAHNLFGAFLVAVVASMSLQCHRARDQLAEADTETEQQS